MRTALIGLWILFVVIGTAVIQRYPSSQTPRVAGVPAAEQRTAQYFESIRNQPNKLEAFLKDMPKGADLHTHLSGAVYAETFMSWAAQSQLCVDPSSFTVSDKCDKTEVKLNQELTKNDPIFYRKLIDAWSTRN
jgi:adenosine deaminase/adenosine deaminase CECR1